MFSTPSILLVAFGEMGDSMMHWFLLMKQKSIMAVVFWFYEERLKVKTIGV